MSDFTIGYVHAPCADRVSGDAERKLASFDVGMVAAVSVGLMVAARVANVMAGLM